MSTPTVLLVANSTATHVGGHLVAAAASLGVTMHVCDNREAYTGDRIRRRLLWWLAGRRPARLRAFNRRVAEAIHAHRPDLLLCTGIAPVTASTLRLAQAAGARRINFLTDDPWNRAHRAPWFLEALPHYDHVWSPRYGNMHDLRRAGVPRVDYLPFAYNPGVHFVQAPEAGDDQRRYDADVLLAGSADADRVPLVAPMIASGLNVALYGGRWGMYRATRRHDRGWLDATGLRKATSAARVCLGLVRRANRDGHSMRTFEVPAMGGCLLAERTSDHERMFGRDGEAVAYFSTPAEALAKVRWLLTHPVERERMRGAGHALITRGGHTYRERLAAMLGLGAS